MLSKCLLLLTAAFLALQSSQQTQNKRIMGGNVAEVGQFPYMVGIKPIVVIKTDGQVIKSEISTGCGGSLIHPEWILTAAHCLIGNKNVLPSALSMYPNASEAVIKHYTAYMGTVLKDDSNAQKHEIESIHIHPDYKTSSTSINDVAVAQLKEPFELNDHVKTIPLPTESLLRGQELRKQFKNCTLSGYGALGGAMEQNAQFTDVVKSDRLMFLDFVPKSLKQLPTEEMQDAFQGQKYIFMIDKNQKYSPMPGDSGSPIVCGGYQFGVGSRTGRGDEVLLGIFEFVPEYENFIRSYVPEANFAGSSKEETGLRADSDASSFTLLLWFCVEAFAAIYFAANFMEDS